MDSVGLFRYLWAVRPHLKVQQKKEVRWGERPVKARLVRTSNQWGIKKTFTN